MTNLNHLSELPLMNAADCIPFAENSSNKGSILALKPSFLIGEYKQQKYQLVLCTEDADNGKPLTVEFITDDMSCRDYCREDFIGVVKPWRVPLWAKERINGRELRRRAQISCALRAVQKDARRQAVSLSKELNLLPEDFELTENKSKEQTENCIIPFYTFSYDEAVQLGENHKQRYISSFTANAACTAFIRQSAKVFCNGINIIPYAASRALEVYGAERVQYILANTIQSIRNDGKKYASLPVDVRSWAETIPIIKDVSGNVNRLKYLTAKCGTDDIAVFTEQVLNKTVKSDE